MNVLKKLTLITAFTLTCLISITSIQTHACNQIFIETDDLIKDNPIVIEVKILSKRTLVIDETESYKDSKIIYDVELLTDISKSNLNSTVQIVSNKFESQYSVCPAPSTNFIENERYLIYSNKYDPFFNRIEEIGRGTQTSKPGNEKVLDTSISINKFTNTLKPDENYIDNRIDYESNLIKERQNQIRDTNISRSIILILVFGSAAVLLVKSILNKKNKK